MNFCVLCHISCVLCHIACVLCHISFVLDFQILWQLLGRWIHPVQAQETAIWGNVLIKLVQRSLLWAGWVLLQNYVYEATACQCCMCAVVCEQVRGYQRACRRAACLCSVSIKSGDDIIVFDQCGPKKSSQNSNQRLQVNMYMNGDLTPGTIIRRKSGGAEYTVSSMCLPSSHI